MSTSATTARGDDGRAKRHFVDREPDRSGARVGGAYLPNTLLVIDRLVREEFLIEVSAVAAQ
jgi:hypothetical protein